MQRGSIALTPAFITLLAVLAFLAVLNFAITPTNTSNQNESTNTGSGNTNVENTNGDRQLITNTSETVNTNTTPDPTAGWIQYENEKWGFAFRYPNSFQVNRVDDFGDGILVATSGQTTVSGESVAMEFDVRVNPDGYGPILQYKKFTVEKTKQAFNILNETTGGDLGARYTYQAVENDPGFDITGWVNAPAVKAEELFKLILTTFTFTDPTAGWETFSNTAWDISFKHPVDWLVRENTLTPTLQEPGDYVTIGPPNASEIRSYKKGIIIEANGLGRGGPPSHRFYNLERHSDGTIVITKETETCESFGANICDGTYGFLVAAQLPTGDERNGFFLQFPSSSYTIPDPTWVETVKQIIGSMKI